MPAKTCLRKKYDELYAKGQTIINEFNPCGKDGCHFNFKLHCCGGCRHLGDNGCKVKALYCKLWLCSRAADYQKEAVIQLNKLLKEADKFNLLYIRGSKRTTLKRRLYASNK
ncbi:MAG: hypothetical protein DRI24_08380 [Deltaproteobacteria bacterium]|nr:MAG: hypothetical protein DRI24_08380 [Deltaproteobacteria bacterium]